MRSRYEYFRRYKKRLKNRVRTIFGNRCCSCFTTEKLEFAHRARDSFNGMGRGSQQRYRDIVMHIEKYLLLCQDCHRDYDRRNNNNVY